MKKALLEKIVEMKNQAEKIISKFDDKQKTKLEESWDVEHAYYSSALEGSKLDRSEFEMLAKESAK